MALVNCKQCGGTGQYLDPIQGMIDCPECRGSGKIETDWVGSIGGLVRNQTVHGEKIDALTASIESQDIEIADIKAAIALQDVEIAAIKVMCDKIDNIKNKCDNIKDKCDQIWDKVKDM